MPIPRGVSSRRLNRRSFARLAAGALIFGWTGSAARGQVTAGLLADDGSPIRSFAAPDRKRLLDLPTPLIVGIGETLVVEFFDYNCGYCRQAAPGLDQMLREDKALRLVFIHNPILSPGSARAAETIAAIQIIHGVGVAYEIHKRALAAAGRVSEDTILELARAGGLDEAPIVATMPAAREAVRAQRQFASDNRLRYTPTFSIGNTAFIGWPGVPSMERFLAAVRRCGTLQCSDPQQ